MAMKHVIRSASNQFASGLPKEVDLRIKSMVSDPNLTLARLARMEGVSLDTVLRRRGQRLTRLQTQRQYFSVFKTKFVMPLVLNCIRRRELVTVQGIQKMLKAEYRGNFSRFLVSRALEELRTSGLKFRRPKEYFTAKARAKVVAAKWKPLDDLIVRLRRQHPEKTDPQILVVINNSRDEKDKITYATLRRRIAKLKKNGRLPRVRRGYKKI